eukprot:4365072-Pleurochrysis_carterae.AAC.3
MFFIAVTGSLAGQRGTMRTVHVFVYSQLGDALLAATPETILACFAKPLCKLKKRRIAKQFLTVRPESVPAQVATSLAYIDD